MIRSVFSFLFMAASLVAVWTLGFLVALIFTGLACFALTIIAIIAVIFVGIIIICGPPGRKGIKYFFRKEKFGDPHKTVRP